MKTAHVVVLAGSLLVVASCSRSEAPQSERAPATPSPATPPAAPPASEATRARDKEDLPRSSTSKAGELSLEDATRELALVEKQLGDAVALSTPDCPLAKTLRDRICELSGRICELTGATAHPVMTERCDDGKRRCEKARTNVGARCD